MGRIRFLVKLHKPKFVLRRVEAATRSPYKNAAAWANVVLSRCLKHSSSTVADAKQVILGLRDLPPLDDDVWLFTADIVDYYPRIRLDKLEAALRYFVRWNFL